MALGDLMRMTVSRPFGASWAEVSAAPAVAASVADAQAADVRDAAAVAAGAGSSAQHPGAISLPSQQRKRSGGSPPHMWQMSGASDSATVGMRGIIRKPARRCPRAHATDCGVPCGYPCGALRRGGRNLASEAMNARLPLSLRHLRT
jgi:hypothetical protein